MTNANSIFFILTQQKNKNQKTISYSNELPKQHKSEI